MALVYTEERAPYTGPTIPRDKLNAVGIYLRHYENFMYLSFMLQNGDRAEKQQASKELAMCERKMKWAQSLPRYDHQAAMTGVENIKKGWK